MIWKQIDKEITLCMINIETLGAQSSSVCTTYPSLEIASEKSRKSRPRRNRRKYRQDTDETPTPTSHEFHGEAPRFGRQITNNERRPYLHGFHWKHRGHGLRFRLVSSRG